jgi:hypothetical protein
VKTLDFVALGALEETEQIELSHRPGKLPEAAFDHRQVGQRNDAHCRGVEIGTRDNPSNMISVQHEEVLDSLQMPEQVGERQGPVYTLRDRDLVCSGVHITVDVQQPGLMHELP